MKSLSFRRQRGAALIVGLIMLLLLTLVVGSAFTLSGTNLKAVGNMQVRAEAIAAANSALEQVIGSNLKVAQVVQEFNIDIDNDDSTDYVVTVTPSCLSDSEASYASPAGLSGEEIKNYGGQGPPEVHSGYNVILDLKADVVDAASGANVSVRTGVRVLLNEAQRAAVCS